MAITASSRENSLLKSLITVRNFSLVDDHGEHVLHPDFDRRRLSNRVVTKRLTLEFSVLDDHFAFKFERSRPIFAPNATIKIIGRVRSQTRDLLIMVLQCIACIPVLLHA